MSVNTIPITIGTDNSLTKIYLSGTVLYGHEAATVFRLNQFSLPSVQDDFSKILIGTNAGLKGNKLLVSTTVSKRGNTDNTEVDYALSGTPADDDIVPSIMSFDTGDFIAYHIIIYKFV